MVSATCITCMYLDVRGELVNRKRSLTHAPVLKAGHPGAPQAYSVWCFVFVYTLPGQVSLLFLLSSIRLVC